MTTAARLAGFLLLVGFAILAGQPPSPASAQTTGSVAIGCEFLFDAIDGDPNDVVQAVDVIDSCDDLDAGEVALLASALGDEDDTLGASDFIPIDLDDNQIRDVRTTATGALPTGVSEAIVDEIYMIAFVNDDSPVTFDADAGVVVAVNRDLGGLSLDSDVNAESCTAEDDADCDGTTPSTDDGDGVVVATIVDATANDDAGIWVDVSQADEVSEVTAQFIEVSGAADEVDVTLANDTIQAASALSLQTVCENNSDVTDLASPLPTRTFVRAVVTDNDGDPLTRVPVQFSVDDEDLASIDSDVGEPGSDPAAQTGISIDRTPGEIAAYAVICGGVNRGSATVTATINEGSAGQEDTSAPLEVVGEPAWLDLAAFPAQVDCDGANTSTVAATVLDLDGNHVADGNNVTFSVVAEGTAFPVNATTVDGVASTAVTPAVGASGVTVIVTSGDAQASIRI